MDNFFQQLDLNDFYTWGELTEDGTEKTYYTRWVKGSNALGIDLVFSGSSIESSLDNAVSIVKKLQYR